MKIAVAGGTGVVGRHVVEVAGERGHEVLVLARSVGVDLTTAEGLDLAGVDALVDTSSIVTTTAPAAERFFRTVTDNLLAAEQRAGVGHHVALSIVGIDSAPYGYYAGKLAQERAVSAGPVPWTILRATQFHEFAGQIFDRFRVGPFALVPRFQSQPVAAREVAERLVDLVEAGPSGRVRDLAGPRVERMGQLSRRWARAVGRPGRVIEFPLPGGFGKAMRNGILTARPGSDLGAQTFDEWLVAQG